FAVVAPVLRTVTDDTRAAETAALQQDVTALSGAVSVELERARLSLDPAVARAAQILAAPTKSTSHDLSQVLGRLISPEGSIVSAALLDEDGAAIAHVEAPGAGPRATPDSLLATVQATAAGEVAVAPDSAVADEVVAGTPIVCGRTVLATLVVRIS